MSAPIQILEVRRLEGSGSLRAFAKVKLGAVVIHGCRIIQQPGQRPWVALPQIAARPTAGGTGRGWFPVIEITSPDLLARVRAAVLEAWAAPVTTPPATPPDPLTASAEERKRHAQQLADAFQRQGLDDWDDQNDR